MHLAEEKQEKFLSFCKKLASNKSIPPSAGEIALSLSSIFTWPYDYTSEHDYRYKSPYKGKEFIMANEIVKRYAETTQGEVYQTQMCALALGTVYAFLAKIHTTISDEDVVFNLWKAYIFAKQKFGDDNGKNMHAFALIMIFKLHPIIDKILLQANRQTQMHLSGYNAVLISHIVAYCGWLNKNLPYDKQISLINKENYYIPVSDDQIARYRDFIVQINSRYQANIGSTNIGQSTSSQSQSPQKDTSMVNFSLFKPNLDAINNLAKPVTSPPLTNLVESQKEGCCCSIM